MIIQYLSVIRHIFPNFSIFFYDSINFNNNCKKRNKLSEHKELENISKNFLIEQNKNNFNIFIK